MKSFIFVIFDPFKMTKKKNLVYNGIASYMNELPI